MIKWIAIIAGSLACLGTMSISGFVLYKQQKPELPVAIQVADQVETLATPAPEDQKKPVLKSDANEPDVSAQSVIVFDTKTNHVIYGKNEHNRLMPASTTKIATALIALQEFDHEEIVTIVRAADAIGHTVDFVPGEQIKAIDLITAMMVNSGNDAAIALADHHPQGYQTFVELMNQKVMSLGLKNTHFSNVSGVEADDHFSSSYDLAVLANHAMKSDVFRQIVATKTGKVSSIDGKYTHATENLNELLWEVEGVIGVKTGWTPVAGDCLVTYTSRNHDIITVVLNSTDRFTDSKTIIEWAFTNTDWP